MLRLLLSESSKHVPPIVFMIVPFESMYLFNEFLNFQLLLFSHLMHLIVILFKNLVFDIWIVDDLLIALVSSVLRLSSGFL